MSQPNHILIRLPNWLGDIIMSTSFLEAVREEFPQAQIDLIAKKGLETILDYFPDHNKKYVFCKQQYKGTLGAWKFGREIKVQKKYDLFFCLPNSFSSGIMGYAIGSKKRIGFKNEMRSLLFTHSYQKKKGLHRVEEYVDLLQQYLKKEIVLPKIYLKNTTIEKKDFIVININSEASSRRLPKEKAISIINFIRKDIAQEIILIGSNKEKKFVDSVYNGLENKKNIANLAGQTNLQQMVDLFSQSKLVLTTDSGPAHVANALGIHTVVLFGAGNENNTAPYNNNRSIMRLAKLSCEPCVKNECKIYGIPECLLQLNEKKILFEIKNILLN